MRAQSTRQPQNVPTRRPSNMVVKYSLCFAFWLDKQSFHYNFMSDVSHSNTSQYVRLWVNKVWHHKCRPWSHTTVTVLRSPTDRHWYMFNRQAHCVTSHSSAISKLPTSIFVENFKVTNVNLHFGIWTRNTWQACNCNRDKRKLLKCVQTVSVLM